MKKGICVFCGEEAELTDDHIPPKSIYPKSIRSSLKKMNTENACWSCNNGSKVEDELFKVFVGIVGLPVWREELEESVDRTLKTNIKLSNELESNTKIYNEASENGNTKVIISTAMTNSQRDMLIEVVKKCAMAFFYKAYGKIMKFERSASLVNPSGFYSQQLEEFEYEISKASWGSVNANTCNYAFLALKNSDILFVLKLYGNIEFFLLLRSHNFNSKIYDLKLCTLNE